MKMITAKEARNMVNTRAIEKAVCDVIERAIYQRRYDTKLHTDGFNDSQVEYCVKILMENGYIVSKVSEESLWGDKYYLHISW